MSKVVKLDTNAVAEQGTGAGDPPSPSRGDGAMTSAAVIAAWRAEHPGERLAEKVLLDILGLSDLRYTDLRGADLQFADLRYANLADADLRGADLEGVSLAGANLQGANLQGANLRDADLEGVSLAGANLRGANLRGAPQTLSVRGLPSGAATLVPTCDGWVLQVGCWTGKVDGLRELIAQDAGWPEATGDEVAQRRPGLAALADLADAHIAANPGVIEDLAQRWGLVS